MFILFEISHEGNSVMYNRFVFMVFLFWGRNFMEDDRLNNLKEFWDSMAGQFTDFDIPTPYNNEFMKLLYLKGILEAKGYALDIGCGTGKYSLALSPYFEKVIGTDISDNMINAAKRRSLNEEIKNTDYKCLSWQELNADKFGWKNKFNFVFAHMTPAVNSLETIKKMRYVSKNWCAVTKSVCRNNKIADAVNKICGNIINGYGENEINGLLSMLWADGLKPELFYESEVWDNELPLQKAIDSYIKRMTVKKDLTNKEKSDITDYFNSIALNGMVKEISDVTICTVYWKENKGDI